MVCKLYFNKAVAENNLLPSFLVSPSETTNRQVRNWLHLYNSYNFIMVTSLNKNINNSLIFEFES